MLKFFTFTLLLVSFSSFAQLQGTVLDAETQEPISYVNIWIENENIGTTADEIGRFSLPVVDKSKVVIFSAVGYETFKISYSSVKNTVELKPKVISLAQVNIRSVKFNNKITVDKFSKKRVRGYFVCGEAPWMEGKYFNYKEEYDKTPFINNFRVLTRSDIHNARFQVRLYGVSVNGELAEPLHDKKILVTAKKGRAFTEVDVSNLNLKFPENGLVFAVEWLIIEENKPNFKYTEQGNKEKKISTNYEPSLAALAEDTNLNSWRNFKGKWYKKEHLPNASFNKKGEEKYLTLAVEMTLSD